MQKYAFVDRDGTFLKEPPLPAGIDHPVHTYPYKDIDEFQFMDGAFNGLKALVDKGYHLVLATNQAGLGTPDYPRELYDDVTRRMMAELAEHGIFFDFVMMCPHMPDAGCECRKPKIGGLAAFLKENEGRVDFAHSLMFGDRETDRQFAENLGVRFVKIERNSKFEVPTDL